MIRTPKPICSHPLENTVTITFRNDTQKIKKKIKTFYTLTVNVVNNLSLFHLIFLRYSVWKYADKISAETKYKLFVFFLLAYCDTPRNNHVN